MIFHNWILFVFVFSGTLKTFFKEYIRGKNKYIYPKYISEEFMCGKNIEMLDQLGTGMAQARHIISWKEPRSPKTHHWMFHSVHRSVWVGESCSWSAAFYCTSPAFQIQANIFQIFLNVISHVSQMFQAHLFLQFKLLSISISPVFPNQAHWVMIICHRHRVRLP